MLVNTCEAELSDKDYEELNKSSLIVNQILHRSISMAKSSLHGEADGLREGGWPKLVPSLTHGITEEYTELAADLTKAIAVLHLEVYKFVKEKK